MPISKEDVRNGFQMILGREPENKLTLLKYMLFPNIESFRAYLLRSDEFRGKFKGLCLEVQSRPETFYERPAVAFVHLQKTGGMTFDTLLRHYFEHNRICQVRENNLHLLSIAELGWFDLFSGHFDYAATRYIQRRDVRTLAFFREPRKRLISFYRYMRAHPPADEFASSLSVRLANALTAEEFFEHEEIRGAPEVFNHYLLNFGLSAYEVQRAGRLDLNLITPEVLNRAKQNLQSLTSVGLTEHFNESIEIMFKTLGFRVPVRIFSRNVTDKLSKTDARFSKAEPVILTPRLHAALDDLVRFDEELYALAAAEYGRRRSRAGLPLRQAAGAFAPA